MESVNDMLIACVKACGGSKQVGALLWPEKTPEAAQRSLLDALNEDRPAKLSPEQVVYILRLARQKNFHDGMEYLSMQLGYSAPVPVEPEDEMAALKRQFIQAQAGMVDLMSRMERIAGVAR